MPAPLSHDLRTRVLAAYDRGMPTIQIARTFAVSPAWARRLKQRRRETGEVGPRPMGGATIIKVDREKLARLVSEQPDATLKELWDRLGVRCAQSTICHALKAIGMSFKERRSTRRSRTGPMSPSAGPSGCSSVSACPSAS
jgi:transposase